MAIDSDRPAPQLEGLLDLDEPEEGSTTATADQDGLELPVWKGEDRLFIDVKGNIHVRGGRFFYSRVVGNVRGKDAEATIGELVGRFQALEDRFLALQQEVSGSRNLVRSLKSMRSFVRWVEGAQAIGDFEDLLERAHAVIEQFESEVEARRAARLAVAERAEELATSTQWRSTAGVMNELMEEWKRIGPAGGEEDEALWERFRTARHSFFTGRARHHAELKRARNAAHKAKQSLIARAEELASSTDWEATFEAMQALMEEWKGAGSAGHERDDELWQRFRAVREPFFEARKAHISRQRTQARQRDRDRGAARAGRDGRGAGGRGRSTGTLRASLAEIAGPLKELFPSVEPQDSTQQPEARRKDKPRRR